MEWVNNVITVQALPQDRHISWPTPPFLTVRHPASSPSGILHPPSPSPPPRRPHPHPRPPLATGHYVLVLSPACIRRSPGYTLVRGLSRYPPSLSSLAAIVSIDACATRLYARANLPCAERRSSINSLVQHTGETSRRVAGTRALGKTDSPAPVPRIVFFPRCSFFFPPCFSFSPHFTPCHFFFFFSRETSLLLPPFPQRARQR